MVGYHYTFLILKCFLVYRNLNEVVSVGFNLTWTVVICPGIHNISRMQIWKNLLNLPRWFQLCPSLNEAISITRIWLKLLESAQMFVTVCKFKWMFCILPKLKWSCLKFLKLNKAVWSYPKLNEDEQCSISVKGAPNAKRTKCNSIAKARKWDDTYLRYVFFARWPNFECSSYIPTLQE